jgi:NAD(P)-dependent dehydrogenase (short-subunit alcohol dehydrogenase family)
MASDQSSPYSKAHLSPKGSGDARPTALQVVKDNHREAAWADHIILITGCSSGLGVETARALRATGAKLYLTARNLDKARGALGGLVEGDRVQLLELDLECLDSVRSCVKTFLTKEKRLNILICNAGIRHVPFGKTKDGFERHMGVNHLSHFLLTQLLMPTLQASSTMTFQSRVVAVSSWAHRNSSIEFNDLQLEREDMYTPSKAYAQSKLANVYMTSEISRRYGAPAAAFGKPGVWGFAIHPGGIKTGLQQQDAGIVPELLRSWYMMRNVVKILNMMKSPEQGAATTVLAAVGKTFEGRGAMYLEDCGEAVPVKDGWGLLDDGYLPGRTDNQQDANRLWNVSCRLVGVKM